LVHATILSQAEKNMRLAVDASIDVPILTLERLTFRFVSAGFVLLTATLLAGGLFGDSLYGANAAWRWDHQTVFSFLSWATVAVSPSNVARPRTHRKRFITADTP
jgi:ABC-type uncharacterized transport system permease subunit